MSWGLSPERHSATAKSNKLLYASSLSGQSWNTPALPGAPIFLAPIWALNKEPKTQPLELIRDVLSPPPSYISTRTLRCSLLRSTPICGGLQFFHAPSVKEHPFNHLHHPILIWNCLQSIPAAHFSSIQASLPPTPPDSSQKTWIHQHSGNTTPR